MLVPIHSLISPNFFPPKWSILLLLLLLLLFFFLGGGTRYCVLPPIFQPLQPYLPIRFKAIHNYLCEIVVLDRQPILECTDQNLNHFVSIAIKALKIFRFSFSFHSLAMPYCWLVFLVMFSNRELRHTTYGLYSSTRSSTSSISSK